VERQYKTGGFDIAANFSAYKHVLFEKDIYSVEALLRNNVINARILLDLLCEFQPAVYFFVSTDKEANPSISWGEQTAYDKVNIKKTFYDIEFTI